MVRASTARRPARDPVVVFAALGDETRLRLVSRLCDQGPRSIAELTEGSRVTRQAITKHLRVLEGAGLARCVRDGREAVWELNSRPMDEARSYLELIAKRWDDALGRLKTFVER